MARSDLYPGIFLVIFGGLVFWRASTFPIMAGIPYGPGLFPSIAAIGMMVCGALLVVGAVLRRDRSHTAIRPRIRFNPRAGARVLALVVTVALYALLLDTLGFHIASLLAITAAAMLFGLRWWQALLLAFVLTVSVHFVFYSLMHVPLPWGVLTPVAW